MPLNMTLQLVKYMKWYSTELTSKNSQKTHLNLSFSKNEINQISSFTGTNISIFQYTSCSTCLILISTVDVALVKRFRSLVQCPSIDQPQNARSLFDWQWVLVWPFNLVTASTAGSKQLNHLKNEMIGHLKFGKKNYKQKQTNKNKNKKQTNNTHTPHPQNVCFIYM